MSTIHEELRNFIGSQTLYFNEFLKTPQYTEGVRYLLQNGAKGMGCIWLFELIATEPAIRKQAEDFASIKVFVANRKAHITVDDGNRTKPVFESVIGHTDLEPGMYHMYWTNEVLLLASEY